MRQAIPPITNPADDLKQSFQSEQAGHKKAQLQMLYLLVGGLDALLDIYPVAFMSPPPLRLRGNQRCDKVVAQRIVGHLSVMAVFEELQVSKFSQTVRGRGDTAAKRLGHVQAQSSSLPKV